MSQTRPVRVIGVTDARVLEEQNSYTAHLHEQMLDKRSNKLAGAVGVPRANTNDSLLPRRSRRHARN